VAHADRAARRRARAALLDPPARRAQPRALRRAHVRLDLRGRSGGRVDRRADRGTPRGLRGAALREPARRHEDLPEHQGRALRADAPRGRSHAGARLGAARGVRDPHRPRRPRHPGRAAARSAVRSGRSRARGHRPIRSACYGPRP
jgi:hypothetical protein